MARREDSRITNLADLGKHFGLAAPQAPVTRPERDDFYSQSVLSRLRFCDSNEARGLTRAERRERTVATIGDVLKMPKEERGRLRIRVVVVGDFDTQGRLKAEDEDIKAAGVRVLFPANFEGKKRMIDTSDDILTEQEGIDRATILESADGIMQETTAELQNRMRMNIKSLDTQISTQKKYSQSSAYTMNYERVAKQVSTAGVTQEMERLNKLKTIAVWRFLDASRHIENDNPQLQPLFITQQENDPLLINLSMWTVDEETVLRRTINPHIPQRLRDARSLYSTTLNKEALQNQYEKYRTSPVGVPSHVKAGHNTWELLLSQQTQERTRQSGTESIERTAARRQPSTEVPPDLTNFEKQSVDRQLQGALNDLRASRDQRVERKKAYAERDTAIRNALAMSPDARKAAGIEIRTIAPLDEAGNLAIENSEYTEYSVYAIFGKGKRKQFLSTHRSALSNPLAPLEVDHEALASIDALVQTRGGLERESSEAAYIRRVRELNLISRDLEKLSMMRKATISSDFLAKAAITKDLEKLQGHKTIIALAALELAGGIQAEHTELSLTSVEKKTREEIAVIDVDFSELQQTNILAWMLGETDKRQFGKVRHQHRIRFYPSHLLRLKAAFEAGDHSEVNTAAIGLIEKLQGMGIEI